MRVLVFKTDADKPQASMREAAEADAVVLCHSNGAFTLWKYRYGEARARISWDQLPPEIKREVKL